MSDTSEKQPPVEDNLPQTTKITVPDEQNSDVRESSGSEHKSLDIEDSGSQLTDSEEERERLKFLNEKYKKLRSEISTPTSTTTKQTKHRTATQRRADKIKKRLSAQESP